jgi:hypothetical protein
MADSSEKTLKSQPWKANWPPKSSKKDGEMFAAKKGDFMAVDGGSTPRKPSKPAQVESTESTST